jgi:hypothetical protein
MMLLRRMIPWCCTSRAKFFGEMQNWWRFCAVWQSVLLRLVL